MKGTDIKGVIKKLQPPAYFIILKEVYKIGFFFLENIFFMFDF